MTWDVPRPPAQAHLNYQENADRLRGLAPEALFTEIFRTNLWNSGSVSGPGSEQAQTTALRRDLPALLRRLGVRSLLDAPCGDFGWLSTVDLGLESYIGADIVAELTERNTERYATGSRRFRTLDITADALPRTDAVLCRDCLVHLSFADIHRAIANFRASGATYLISTTFPELERNDDIETGDWRPLNLRLAPFHLPAPEAVLLEGCTEENGAYADKTLAAWRLRA